MPSELSLGEVNEEAGTPLTLHGQGLSHTADAGLPGRGEGREPRGSRGPASNPAVPSYSLQQESMERMGHSPALPDSTSHSQTSQFPFLENGANADFPALLGAPDEIIYENTL